MSLMRTYRRALGLSQSAFAAQLNVPLETYRPWDAGRREPPPQQLLTRARTLAPSHRLGDCADHDTDRSQTCQVKHSGPNPARFFESGNSHMGGMRRSAARWQLKRD